MRSLLERRITARATQGSEPSSDHAPLRMCHPLPKEDWDAKRPSSVPARDFIAPPNARVLRAKAKLSSRRRRYAKRLYHKGTMCEAVSFRASLVSFLLKFIEQLQSFEKPNARIVNKLRKCQEKRDYRYKRSEYAARGISEYWIVDAIQQKVTILELVEGFYEEKVYRGSDRIYSSLLTKNDLTAEEVLQRS